MQGEAALRALVANRRRGLAFRSLWRSQPNAGTFGAHECPEAIMRAHPRERFSSAVSLTPSSVVAFANAAGDNNPIHHDPDFAASTRFGRPTASGPHTTALLLALTASHFSKKGAMLGLEFWVRFRRIG